MKKIMKTLAFAFIATIAVNTASAQYSMDANGVGFASKNSVQAALGWNNKQLQDGAAGLVFSYSSTEVSEVEWTCTNDNRNATTQERARTTTVSVSKLVSAVARVNKQITGFNLTGFGASTSTSETEGPAVNSCPTNWALTVSAGAPVVISSTPGHVSVDGTPLFVPVL
jgi:hypothetical protein